MPEETPGKIEGEIEIFQHKLKRIKEGVTFGGKGRKFARCQGQRIQVTVEQETTRILGNLALTYLQLWEYTIAEEKYSGSLLKMAPFPKRTLNTEREYLTPRFQSDRNYSGPSTKERYQ